MTGSKGSQIVEVRGLYKIFGDSVGDALKLAEKGLSRDSIKKRTGQLVALKNISFSVKEGEIFVVMGLSGSGKSTLLRCMNRLISTTKGQVLIGGESIPDMDSNSLRGLRRKKITMVFQHFGLLPHRTILGNVMFGLEIQGVSEEERRKKAEKAVRMVGLSGWEHNTAAELSGGMQQRVGLARALATEPSILLMDEPFSALDPLIRNQMQDELLKLQDKMKKTIIFITHDLDEALKLGDRIAILNEQGEIVQMDTPENIVMKPASTFVRTFVQKVDKQNVIRIGTIMKRKKAGKKVPSRSGREAVKKVKGRKKTKGRDVLDKDMTINQALPLLLKSKRPVPVADEENRIVGEITREKVIRILEGKNA
ncbi:MAG: betaine/proline/choline family ABC transporter ATP-binding protein [Candidatus Woesearchaeota archaeon]